MTVTQVCDFLNGLLASDHDAISRLASNRVPCNLQLAESPCVQVKEVSGNYLVGLLGVLNGILLYNGGLEVVAAVYDEQERLLHFEPVNYR